MGRAGSLRSALGFRVEHDMSDKLDLDTQKIDDAVLALLLLGLHGDKHVPRAWKSHDWDTLSRLHDAGFIHDPVGKSKSIVFTPEGLKRSEQLLHDVFGQREHEHENAG